MSDCLDYNVRYGEEEEKRKTKPFHVRVFHTRIDEVSSKLMGYQDNISARFEDVLDERPTKARLTSKLTNETVRWSCVHETMELVALAIAALTAIKVTVVQDTLTDCKNVANCLDETASKQYSTLMLAENQDLWSEFCEKVCARFTTLQAWANSNPKMYNGIKATAGVAGLFTSGGGVGALVAHFLPETWCELGGPVPEAVCELGGPVMMIGGLIAVVVGGCVIGIAYVMQQEKKRKNAFNGALLAMIQDLNRDMQNAPDLSEVLKLLQTTREQAAAKWGGLLAEEHKQGLLPNLGDCSICLCTLLTREDLVVPITGAEECRRNHVFHAGCLRSHGHCPLCRRNYLVVKHLELADPHDHDG